MVQGSISELAEEALCDLSRGNDAPLHPDPKRGSRLERYRPLHPSDLGKGTMPYLPHERMLGKVRPQKQRRQQ